MKNKLNNCNVLVLSSSWEPLYHSDWKKALTNVFNGRAEIIQNYDNISIKAANSYFPYPKTIRMLSSFVKAKLVNKNNFYSKSKLTKKNLWLRDKGKCQYCFVNLNVKTSTVDHVLPKSRGGKSTWENLVISCVSCNSKKGPKTPAEANMPLKIKPRIPNQNELIFIKEIKK
jgi:5-methylcytosine-specific restriction endonuclease McrA